jgi:hypothetical protein
MSFIKKEKPPPDVKEGEVLQAEIVDITYPVESKFKSAEGEPKQQIDFRLRLPDGYEARSWMAFFERPSERSNLGMLCNTLMALKKAEYKSVKEALEELKEHGRVYVRVSGFREWQEKLYPKFKVVPNKLPPLQTKIEPTKPSPTKEGTTQPPKVTAETLQFIQKSKEIIELGLPLNESDWNGTVPVQVRAELLKLGLVDKRANVYFFSEDVNSFL